MGDSAMINLNGYRWYYTSINEKGGTKEVMKKING